MPKRKREKMFIYHNYNQENQISRLKRPFLFIICDTLQGVYVLPHPSPLKKKSYEIFFKKVDNIHKSKANQILQTLNELQYFRVERLLSCEVLELLHYNIIIILEYALQNVTFFYNKIKNAIKCWS